ncbi:hypothetical protein [Caulobacter sp. Root1472]|uniref:hypothetical protein n=1 Tax=Caulobacter sp. Root1472 TaxID=1736470 RepID=UPI000AF0BB0D|nr:hypothetical protein [Caulobacter sp. Root1472]
MVTTFESEAGRDQYVEMGFETGMNSGAPMLLILSLSKDEDQTTAPAIDSP